MVSGGSVYIIELERRRRAASDMLPVGTVRGMRREGILNGCSGAALKACCVRSKRGRGGGG